MFLKSTLLFSSLFCSLCVYSTVCAVKYHVLGGFRLIILFDLNRLEHKHPFLNLNFRCSLTIKQVLKGFHSKWNLLNYVLPFCQRQDNQIVLNFTPSIEENHQKRKTCK